MPFTGITEKSIEKNIASVENELKSDFNHFRHNMI